MNGTISLFTFFRTDLRYTFADSNMFNFKC